MRRAWIFTGILLGWVMVGRAQVAEMNWELDYQLYLRMANDSNYTLDIRELFHVAESNDLPTNTEFIFYPVHPGADYSHTAIARMPEQPGSYATLWSALHAQLGGGWIHFVNCMAYALETQSLNLYEPILKRPSTHWKPRPKTETWKRTRKWDYYIPMRQKLAQKEYKMRIQEEMAGDLQNLPEPYIQLFMNTSDKEYKKMRLEGDYRELARIDLVKLLLGARYLGEEQISYISNAVLSAVTNYTDSQLPSVLIFDEFNAAAAMTLNARGYELQSIVFHASAGLSDTEMDISRQKIGKIIEDINRYNQEAFKKRLRNYYKP